MDWWDGRSGGQRLMFVVGVLLIGGLVVFGVYCNDKVACDMESIGDNWPGWILLLTGFGFMIAGGN